MEREELQAWEFEMVQRMVRGWAREFWIFRREEIKDAEQDCFEKWIPRRRQEADQSKTSLAPLLATVVRSVLNDKVKYNLAQKRTGQTTDIADHEDDVVAPATDEATSLLIRKVIAGLPRRLRKICELRAADFSFEEICRTLKLSRRKLESQRALIRKELEKHGLRPF